MKTKSTTETRRHGEESVDLVIHGEPGLVVRNRVIEKDKTFEKTLTGMFSAPPRLRGEIFFKIFRIARAMLREIFDESAYDRFLQRTSKTHSAASYRDFTRERDAAMVKKPRCC